MFTDVSFIDNESTNNIAGAIQVTGSTDLTLIDCSFDNNRAFSGGEHVSVAGSSTIKICGSTSFANPDLNDPAAIVFFGTASQVPCTV